ncbi:thioredoxin-like 1-1, chloroplastic [Amborella trichopoda]|uniref:Thioredoxin domain-containing protein n=1 Tax=Amborella trichopoda TaxID=13333 RepID=W1NGB7_AMBTC|nr:thioredoxin-like 1-1, chloroplastic [Amborella trichopoda]ERM94538.1 hypothetical protein AMTR_s00010p00265830 [Amborella trichopoda]|eukprot:XP_006827301.1 thioredoxin-like 1-1, chloroplastic [Amborella trichopoda]
MAEALGGCLRIHGSTPNRLKDTNHYRLPLRRSLSFSSFKTEFSGRSLDISYQAVSERWVFKNPAKNFTIQAQASFCVSKALRWWEKSLKPNMAEINSTQELVDYLQNAGNKLVILDFYSPSCGGCRALHPKICQFAEMNPDMLFFQVNYEEHKAMCYSLNIHVLPFFRFYRGAHGRLCSFSCTNATIKKFKDALAKHGTDRSSLGPAKGLEDSELLSLASNKSLSFTPSISITSGREIELPVKLLDNSIVSEAIEGGDPAFASFTSQK